jgi:Cysteine-rich CPXCG
MDDDTFSVVCPYCGEPGEVYVEPDVRGQFVQDCEVCCNPWLIEVTRDGADRWINVSRGDGSE